MPLAARGRRAFVAALLGRADRARADIRVVLHNREAPAGTVALARLAEALLVKEDPRALDAHLRAHGECMLAFLGPRERVLFRVLRRLATTPHNAYRSLPECISDVHDRRAWVDAVLPGVGELVDSASGGQSELPELKGIASQAGRGAPSRWWWTRARSSVFITALVMVAWWLLLNPVGLALGMVVAGWWLESWRRSRNLRELKRLALGLVRERSNDARNALTRFASREPTEAVRVQAILAKYDEASGDLESALDHCTKGLAWGGSEACVLTACQARVLAALGREKEALIALGRLEAFPAYAQLDSDRRSVHLIAAAKRGDFKLAQRIAASRGDEPVIRLQEEYLGELAHLEAGEPLTSDLGRRLCAEIAQDPPRRHWLERVAPEALTRLLPV